MNKFNCAREFRLSQRRYDEISSIFHPRRGGGHSGAPDGGSISFGAGIVTLVVAGMVVYHGLYWLLS